MTESSEQHGHSASSTIIFYQSEDGQTYQIDYYNLDAIISVGYRVNPKRGTQFRLCPSSVLKEYLVKGYALNQRRLAEQGVAELRGVLNLLAVTLEQKQLADATGFGCGGPGAAVWA